jgi:UV DNA damage endonuclease
MKIGYPCINNSIPHTSPSTFRLASYSESKLVQTVKDNLVHLDKILRYNVRNNLLFFRISSDLVPFASHPICKLNWCMLFKSEFEQIGDYIKQHDIRISMHPDQFVILNSPNNEVLTNSINELRYHCKILDAMHLDTTAKVQIHVGGVYGNKIEAIERFVKTYNDRRLIDDIIKGRLVIENDDHLFNLMDCLNINKQTGIPILFDNFHHELFCNGEPLRFALHNAMLTWNKKVDGTPMIDYSSRNNAENKKRTQIRKVKHADTINTNSFGKFLKRTEGLDIDVMLEIKDKEKSALRGSKLFKEFGTDFAVASSPMV